jgi:hypothetical protein
MEILQLVDVRVEEASRPLREEVANLKLLLMRFWCFFGVVGGMYSWWFGARFHAVFAFA